MRILVTGREGQVTTALQQAAKGDIEIIALGRPGLDLERPETLQSAVASVAPDLVINPAAYTAVDQAEQDEARAHRVNAVAPGVLAEAAAAIGAPIVHLSTDYVFDGTKPTPYVEGDPTGPVTIYGRTKLEGEHAVLAANPAAVVLRTAWLYAPKGKNFLRTMLKLAHTREEIAVVSDQRGNPTLVEDVAAGVLQVAARLAADRSRTGVYHMTGRGEASWAEFAAEIFRQSAARGGPAAQVRPIPSSDYPTPAKRPVNSRLDCSRIAADFGVELRDWRDALARCLDQTELHT
jgi:dTDP-4-dehydrorhamnose reductase